MSQENLLLFPRKFLPFFRWPLIYIYLVGLCVHAAILVSGLLSYDSPPSALEVSEISEAYLLESLAACTFYSTWSQLNKIVDILDNSQFLDIDSFDDANESKALDILKTVSVVAKIFAIAITSISIFFVLQSIYQNGLVCYTNLPDIQYLTNVTCIIQLLVVYVMVTTVVFMNSCFVCICGTVVSQVRLLNYMESKDMCGLSQLFIGVSLQKGIIKNNNLSIFSIIDRVKNIYSELFVLLYVITVAFICAEMLLFSNELLSIMEYAKRFVSIIALAMQLGYYCFFAQFLMDEVQEVSDAVYSTDWVEQGSKEVGHFVRMVIMRSQSKSLRFTAGNMTDVDRALFVKISQLTFSLFTLLHTMK